MPVDEKEAKIAEATGVFYLLFECCQVRKPARLEGISLYEAKKAEVSGMMFSGVGTRPFVRVCRCTGLVRVYTG